MGDYISDIYIYIFQDFPGVYQERRGHMGGTICTCVYIYRYISLNPKHIYFYIDIDMYYRGTEAPFKPGFRT